MDSPAAPEPSPGRSKARSPNYPSFPLEEAIQKARILHEHEGNSAVPTSVACQHWGLSATSSTGIRAIATVQAFGLVDVEGRGEAKQIRLSETGRTLVRHPDQSSAEYQRALQEAALAPKIHREIWEKYSQTGLPSDKTLGWALEKDWNFLHTSVGQVVAEVRATFSFANLKPTAHTPASDVGVSPASGAPESKGQEPKPMQYVVNPGSGVRDLPLPLISGGTAFLRLPSTLTEEDFQWLTTMLERLKPSLLGQKPEQPPGPTEGSK